MRDWEKDELDEQISQAATLIKKLLVSPEDCELRNVCESWLKEHRAYLPEDSGYDVTKI